MIGQAVDKQTNQSLLSALLYCVEMHHDCNNTLLFDYAGELNIMSEQESSGFNSLKHPHLDFWLCYFITMYMHITLHECAHSADESIKD